MGNDSSANDDRLLELARRMLDGEAIDWEKEDVAESEVREGMKRLQQIVGHTDQAAETETAHPAPRGHSDRIGDFRLVRKLGEGGMGVVYEAEQQQPKRPVALKVIRGGAHVSPDTLKLFRREIQTLARLNHSGVAQLYEAGVTDDGMHFFAMELVRGVPLSDWLRSRPKGPMTPAEMRIRLGLFRKICDAVAYAHQKGVIHRDLKPGNVLIPKPVAGSSMEDAIPGIKVLDFGLARITDSDVQATTFVTEMGKVQGTLPYMSPEQVRGNPDEVDLRTDVYALGVMLYEMVTGRLPYDISKAQIPEAVRIICEEPPRSMTSAFTGTRPLDADVITIANKCLEKESARRYQSAAALGEDVQRYLTDQPILARRPSAAYQFRKLVLRHKGPFAAAAAAFVLLAVFAGAMTVQAVRISKERDRANQERNRANQEASTAQEVSNFLESLFKVSDEWAAHDMAKWRKEISPLELLDRGADRIEREIKDPKIQVRLLRTIGNAYNGLGLEEKAKPIRNRWAELTESVYGQESLEYADVLNWRGGLENNGRAHAIRSRLLKQDDPRLQRSLYWVCCAEGERPHEAEARLRRVLAMVNASTQPDEQVHLWILNDLGIALKSRQDYRGAISLFREALKIRERIYPENHPDRIMGLSNLGYVLLLSGERQEARVYLQAALDAQVRTLGPDHWQVAAIQQSLGELERQEGRLDRARALLEPSLAIFDKPVKNTDPGGAEILVSLGLVDESEGRLAEAIEHLGRAHEIYAHHPGTALRDVPTDYARVLRKAGRVAEAEKIEKAATQEHRLGVPGV
jgi:serine/threonine protein kinase